MARSISNFVNGELVPAMSGATLDITNPATGEVYLTSPLSGAEDVDRAYQAAATAFETWRDTTPSQRQQAMLKFADAIEARADEVVATESENTGKPLALTMSEELPPMAIAAVTLSVRLPGSTVVTFRLKGENFSATPDQIFWMFSIS